MVVRRWRDGPGSCRDEQARKMDNYRTCGKWYAVIGPKYYNCAAMGQVVTQHTSGDPRSLHMEKK